MKKYIINPVTGTRYEMRKRSSKAGTKPTPKGLWNKNNAQKTHDK